MIPVWLGVGEDEEEAGWDHGQEEDLSATCRHGKDQDGSSAEAPAGGSSVPMHGACGQTRCTGTLGLGPTHGLSGAMATLTWPTHCTRGTGKVKTMAQQRRRRYWRWGGWDYGYAPIYQYPRYPPPPQYGYPPYGYPPAQPWAGPPPMSLEEEIEQLEAYKRDLEAEKRDIEDEIKEVEARISELKSMQERGRPPP